MSCWTRLCHMPVLLVTIGVFVIPARAGGDPPCTPIARTCACPCTVVDPPTSDVYWCRACEGRDCDHDSSENYYCFARSVMHVVCSGYDAYCSTTGYGFIECCYFVDEYEPYCSDWNNDCL